MPLDLFITAIIDFTLFWHAERPFANIKVWYDIFAEITDAGIFVAFGGKIVAVRAENNEVGVVAVYKVVSVCYIAQYFLYTDVKGKAVLKFDFNGFFQVSQLIKQLKLGK